MFRSKTGDVDRTNLMVFIHPVILRDAATTNLYTNSKYNDIRSIQLGQDADGVNLMPDGRHPVLPSMDEFSAVPEMEPAVSVDETAVAETEPEPIEAEETTGDFDF